MHNIKTNFGKLYEIVKKSLRAKLHADDDLQFYPNKPKMNDCNMIALALCTEASGIDAENYLWRTIKEDHKNIFELNRKKQF
jgi:hypothetical protein